MKSYLTTKHIIFYSLCSIREFVLKRNMHMRNDPCLPHKDAIVWISTCFWTWPSLPQAPALPSCLSSHIPYQCLRWHCLFSILQLGNYHLSPIKTQFKRATFELFSDIIRDDISKLRQCFQSTIFHDLYITGLQMCHLTPK